MEPGQSQLPKPRRCSGRETRLRSFSRWPPVWLDKLAWKPSIGVTNFGRSLVAGELAVAHHEDAHEVLSIFGDCEVMRFWSSAPMKDFSAATALIDEIHHLFRPGDSTSGESARVTRARCSERARCSM